MKKKLHPAAWTLRSRAKASSPWMAHHFPENGSLVNPRSCTIAGRSSIRIVPTWTTGFIQRPSSDCVARITVEPVQLRRAAVAMKVSVWRKLRARSHSARQASSGLPDALVLLVGSSGARFSSGSVTGLSCELRSGNRWLKRCAVWFDGNPLSQAFLDFRPVPPRILSSMAHSVGLTRTDCKTGIWG
jgi:hypothetical protein